MMPAYRFTLIVAEIIELQRGVLLWGSCAGLPTYGPATLDQGDGDGAVEIAGVDRFPSACRPSSYHLETGVVLKGLWGPGQIKIGSVIRGTRDA